MSFSQKWFDLIHYEKYKKLHTLIDSCRSILVVEDLFHNGRHIVSWIAGGLEKVGGDYQSLSKKNSKWAIKSIDILLELSNKQFDLLETIDQGKKRFEWTPLYFALDKGNIFIALHLLELGANPLHKSTYDTYGIDQGNTLTCFFYGLHFMRLDQRDDNLCWFASTVKIVTLLISKGVDPLARSSWGNDCLKILSEKNNLNPHLKSVLEEIVKSHKNAEIKKEG